MIKLNKIENETLRNMAATDDTGIPIESPIEALQSLAAKGLVEPFEIDGQLAYRLTTQGRVEAMNDG